MKLSDCKAGDKLVADGGFTCIEEGAICTVHTGKEGDLYIKCAAGEHYLAGQKGEAGELVGLTPA